MIAERSDLVSRFVSERDHVFAFVLALTRSREAAEEVVQELSVQVLRRSEREPQPDDALAWLLGAAKHRVADHFRARARDENRLKRLMAMAEDVEAAFLENPPSALGGGGEPPTGNDDPRLAYLRTCLGKLSAKTRLMLDARYARSATIDAIAATLSWTPGSVKVAMSKARRALGECVRRKLAAAIGGGP